MAPTLTKGRCFIVLAVSCLAVMALYLATVSSYGDLYVLFGTAALQKNGVRQESLPESRQPTEGSAANQDGMISGRHDPSLGSNHSEKFYKDEKRIDDDIGNRRWMERQALLQFERKATIKKTCQKHEAFFRNQPLYTSGRVVVMKKRKLIYCTIPKTGSTNWMRAFMVMEGHVQNTSSIGEYEAHFQNGMNYLPLSFVQTHHAEMNAYVKFLQVRHPFDRLLSAYRNKISGQKPLKSEGPQFAKAARHIIQRYRKGASPSDFKLDNLHVTWAEWIQYLINPLEKQGFDAHWMEQHKLCSPCKIQYDFIANLETAADDSKFMFTQLNMDKVAYPDTFPKFGDNQRSDSMRDKYFGNLSRKVLEKLYDIYKLDFELFGYEKPVILNLII